MVHEPEGQARQQVRHDLRLRRERDIPMLHVDLGRSAGHDLVHQIMILPYSHSPSVIKPSQAMSTARHQNGGR